MRPRKLTFAEAIAHRPRRPDVKLGVESPPPPIKISAVKDVYARKLVVPVYEIAEPISVQEAIELATASQHNLTDAEVARVVHLVSSWAAKKLKSARKNRQRILTAINEVVKERILLPENRPATAMTPTRSLSMHSLQQSSSEMGAGTFEAAESVPYERSQMPFAVIVTDKYGTPVMGALVTFIIDTKNSYDRTFPDGRQMATVVTNENGAAMAPTLAMGHFVGTCKVVANITTGCFVGKFTVAATASGSPKPVVFALTMPSPEKCPPVAENSAGLSLIGELEWPILTQRILTRAISKHKLTDIEVAQVIVMANGWAAKNQSAVMNHGWVASGIGTVLRER